MPSISGIEQLSQAIFANRQVRRDSGRKVVGVVSPALTNRKIVAADWSGRLDFDFSNVRS
jgi:hypothetical protein